MIIAIASGKGGTGKTTVAVNLALIRPAQTILADCDVEEPNCALFLRAPEDGADGAADTHRQEVTLPVPQIAPEKCTGCGACAEFCNFSALVSLGGVPLFFAEMCHRCGGCARVCPAGAITEAPLRIGHTEASTVRSADGTPLRFLQGRLDVGVALVPPLIRQTIGRAKELAGPEQEVILLDSPPGTACPAATALRGADYVVLVTEPTAFGLHDLRLAVELARELRKPCGVVVNRQGCGDQRVQNYCRQEGVPLLGEIPDDRRVAQAYSRGEPAVLALPEYRTLFRRLYARILAAAEQDGLCTSRQWKK